MTTQLIEVAQVTEVASVTLRNLVKQKPLKAAVLHRESFVQMCGVISLSVPMDKVRKFMNVC